MSSGKWLTVNGNNSVYLNGQNSGNGQNNSFVGQVRFNTSTSSLEAWDGYTWVNITNFVAIEPSNQMIDILTWAQEKMVQEDSIKKLVDTNPTVADAYATYQRAAEQLAIVAKLVDQ